MIRHHRGGFLTGRREDVANASFHHRAGRRVVAVAVAAGGAHLTGRRVGAHRAGRRVGAAEVGCLLMEGVEMILHPEPDGEGRRNERR